MVHLKYTSFHQTTSVSGLAKLAWHWPVATVRLEHYCSDQCITKEVVICKHLWYFRAVKTQTCPIPSIIWRLKGYSVKSESLHTTELQLKIKSFCVVWLWMLLSGQFSPYSWLPSIKFPNFVSLNKFVFYGTISTLAHIINLI